MNKIYLLLLFFFSVNSATFNNLKQQPCIQTYWGNRGETCDNNMRKCKNFYLCKEGKCAYSNIGTACKVNSDCFMSSDSERIVCVNEKCTKRKYNGYECEHDGECYGAKCTSNICDGFPLGHPCNPSGYVECANGLYCSKGQRKCVRQLKNGDPCEDYELPAAAGNATEGGNFNVICPGGSMCMGNPGSRECRLFRAGAVGKHCFHQYNGDDQCMYGFHCSPSGVCVQDRRLEETFACPGSKTNCSVAEHQICACTLSPIPAGNQDPKEGECLPTIDHRCNLFDALTKWRDCAVLHNCPFDFDPENAFLIDSLEKKTCMGKNCGHIAKNYLCCAHQPYRRNKHSPVSVGPLGCPQGPNGVAIFFIVFFVVVTMFVVAVAGVVIAIFIHKRKGGNKFETLA